MRLIAGKIKNPDKKIKDRPQYDPARDGISISCLGTFLTCREMARCRYVLGLRPRVEGPGREEGSVYHAGMEGAINSIISDGSVDDNSIYKYVDDYVKKSIDRTISTPTILDKIKQAADTAMILIPAHFEYYNEDLNKRWRNLAEHNFTCPIDLGDITINYRGTVDAEYYRKSILDKRVMDHKFMAQIPEGKIDALGLDFQMNGYAVARKARGCDYNVVRKPSLRKKQGESYAQFCTRLTEDIKKRPTWYFQRYKIKFSKEDIKLAEMRLSFVMREFYEWWKRSKDTSLKEKDLMMNGNACDGKYGVCSYVDTCAHNDTSKFF